MVTSQKLLLELTSATVRKTLVRERVRAMRGQVEDALRALDQAAQLVGVDSRQRVVEHVVATCEILCTGSALSKAFRGSGAFTLCARCVAL